MIHVTVADDAPRPGLDRPAGRSLLAAKVGEAARTGNPPSYFCGMGVCMECAVLLNGALIRQCLAQERA